MNKHIFWMIIGCIIPLLLILLLPLFGITGNYNFLIFIIAMFACHLLMPMHHGLHENNENKEQSETLKTDNHESHQH